MKKLKNKVLYTVLSILTLSLLSFIAVFHIQNYFEQKEMVKRNLSMSMNRVFFPIRNDRNEIDRNIRFMDTNVYTVLLDSNNNIIEIINHSNTEIDSNLTDEVNKILTSDKLKKEHIGSLYFDKYSYVYNKGNSLIIIDQSSVRNKLLQSLQNALIIFVVLEIGMIYLSKLIAHWISKPVEETFDKQKEFIADASHELKTPLSVIMASSEALERNPKEKKWLDNIKTESSRMNNLIIDLLDLAKMEKDENMQLIEGNLSRTVELSVLTFEVKAFEKNIKLDYKIEDNIMLKMNENNIKQVIEILLDNAIKHSKQKGHVKVNLNKSSDIILTVSNEGEAIPKEEEEKIFERFYRVDKARNRNDNHYGLGLAIAKNIIEKHHGKISASSNNGITTFKIVFKK